MAGLGLRHGIYANQLRRWVLVDHKLTQGGTGDVALLAVNVEDRHSLTLIAASESTSLSQPIASSAPATPPAPRRAGHIELEVFGARLRLHGDVDAQQLRTLLDALSRRS